MSCPFYGASLVGIKPGASYLGSGQLVAFGGSNRCALITSAQSPCWMEVGEHALPEWGKCWRNPEFMVMVASSGSEDEASIRLGRHFAWLARQMRLREVG